MSAMGLQSLAMTGGDAGWIAVFCALVVVMVLVDARVFHRHGGEVHWRQAASWTAMWVGLALLFNGVVWVWRGSQAAQAFLAGYLVEQALSVDNLFVFLVIFSYFRVPAAQQRRVLSWGILGAVVMRLAFILAGVALLERFHFLMYLMAALLIFTGAKLGLRKDDQPAHPDRNPVLKLARKFLPLAPAQPLEEPALGSAGKEPAAGGEQPEEPPIDADAGPVSVHPRSSAVANPKSDEAFVVRINGRWMFTPLFVVLLVVESTDVAFAVDSIPAILGITRDSFIVFSSNVFAILGLRAMYFLLAGMMRSFDRLHYALAAILVFIGLKMVWEALQFDGWAAKWGLPAWELSTTVSLAVVAGLLVLGVAGSLLWRRAEAPGKGHES